ncbi:cytidine deaminase [Herbihabitans rhizosphaerae]|uniref:Cytidine deaminase n=1 Tax=Herbihabitans rhizosphaerae TaxID=1872711 RepID=A0A4Q7KMP0_9PSEU|nr:cytidine deaminase [Herbihabitans rhizosphaerae]RZS36861.1 cytidine deaminase [Herbihabitans rhizosphaerae]
MKTDWDTLRTTATQAATHAYAPYSKLHVGAAALCDDGRTVTGCNVENVSYGLSLCAECTLVGQLQLTGGGKITALACRDAEGNLLMPCGRCRQLINEFAAPDCLIDTPHGPLPMTDVLPDSFSQSDLPA